MKLGIRVWFWRKDWWKGLNLQRYWWFRSYEHGSIKPNRIRYIGVNLLLISIEMECVY